MTLKEKTQRKIDMVEYYRETNCDKQQFSEKFKVSGDNFFYSVKVIAGNEEKFQELKEKLKEPRKPLQSLFIWIFYLFKRIEELYKLLKKASILIHLDFLSI